jgi:S-(hydroxymethyl)glutathione dehydrogenase/alcohol dehydrogenase
MPARLVQREVLPGDRRSVEYPVVFKAAVLEQINAPLVIDEVRFEGPLRPGQVLVRIHYSGICGKQFEEITGARGHDPYLPHLLGHEGSGVVVDTGEGVTKVRPGDPVVLHWLKGSGMEAEAPLYTRAGARVNAGRITTFNVYGVLSENRVTPLPRGADLKAACLLGCAVTSGVGAVLNDARLRPNESVAVFGCGGVGLNAIQGAALVNGYPIIGVDRNVGSLELARRMGASHVIDSHSDDVLGKIKEITRGEGASCVVVAAGNPEIIELAVQASSVPGTVMLVGVPPRGTLIRVDPFAIHFNRRLMGSYGGGTFPDRDIPRYWDWYGCGRLKLDPLITEVVPLDRINEAMESKMAGRPGRSVIMLEEG